MGVSKDRRGARDAIEMASRDELSTLSQAAANA